MSSASTTMYDEDLKELRNWVDERLAQHTQARATLKEERAALRKARERKKDIEEAVEHWQVVCQGIQQEVHEDVSRVVTTCLQTIFYDRNYSFELRFVRKRNKTEAIPIILSDGHEIKDPLEGDAGGVIDVAAFTCQVCTILLHKPPIRRLLAMDEPFKYVSPEYREGVKELLEMLQKDFGMQFIMVTSHQSQIPVGKEIRL